MRRIITAVIAATVALLPAVSANAYTTDGLYIYADARNSDSYDSGSPGSPSVHAISIAEVNQFEVGHELSEQEYIDFWSDETGPGGVTLLEIHEQSQPGVPASLPIFTSRVILFSDGDVFDEQSGDFKGHPFGYMTYRGRSLSDGAIDHVLINLITRCKLEISIALYLHFDAQPFDEDALVMTSIRQTCWSAWDPSLTNRRKHRIDARLRVTSPTYRLCCEFLESPRNPRFSGILESVLRDGDFRTLPLFAAE